MCKACSNCEHKNKFFPETVFNVCGGISMFNKNSCGFLNRETMQGIFLSICDEVNHPLVFIQKCNTNCQLDESETNVKKICSEKYGCNATVCSDCMQKDEFYDKYYRLESNIFYNRLSGICKYARKEKNVNGYNCGFQRCLTLDAHAAAFFLDNEPFPKEIENKFDEESKKRCFLEYLCPTTHYTEIAIPVMLEEKIVGVLIFGQMLKENNKIEHDNYLEKLSAEFEGDKDFEKNVKTFNDKVYSEEKLSKKIDECIASVEKLENMLEELLGVYRKWYIDEISRELLESFPKIDTMTILNDGLVSTDMSIEKYDKFKASLFDLATSLCTKMSIPKMICFAPDILPNAVYAPKQLYSVNTEKKDEKNDLIFNFENFNSLYPDGQDKIVDQEHIKMVLLNFENKSEEFKDLSFVLYVISGDSQGVMPIAVLVGYHCMKKSKEEKFLSELDLLISKITAPIYVIASAIVNRYKELEQRRFVLMMRHELGQSYAGYLTLMDKFEMDFKSSIIRLENSFSHTTAMMIGNKIQDIANLYNKNSRTFAHTVMLRVNGTRYSGGVQSPKKRYFYPYGEFLFKWNYIFSETQKNKHLRFKTPMGDVYLNPHEYPLMFADPDMIEQVAFNLTNNAMKYSLFGSSVTLNCYADRIRNEYILEVINYASPLSEDDLNLIFEFGYSGKNHGENGSGLGLYISREIALRHDGNLTVEQDLVSEYNVPLLQLYTKDVMTNLFSDTLFDEVQQEIKRLKLPKEDRTPSEWSQILGEPIPQKPFTPLYIRENIKKQTARIKLTLTIPLHKSKDEDVE